MKKYYICCDMEGISGVSNFKETDQQNFCACKLMTDEVKAICNAINNFHKDETIEIVIADSHAQGLNINHLDLPENTKLIRGFPRPFYMLTRLDDSYEALFLVGFHAKAGSDAIMSHTFSHSSIYKIEINDKEIGEFELNAGLASEMHVPIAYVSGDDKFIKQISNYKQNLGFETLVTKESISFYSAMHYHPKYIEKKIYKVIEKTLSLKAWQNKFLYFECPLKVKLTFTSTLKADLVSLLPIIKRISGREIYFEMDNFLNFYNLFCAITLMCWNDKI